MIGPEAYHLIAKTVVQVQQARVADHAHLTVSRGEGSVQSAASEEPLYLHFALVDHTLTSMRRL